MTRACLLLLGYCSAQPCMQAASVTRTHKQARVHSSRMNNQQSHILGTIASNTQGSQCAALTGDSGYMRVCTHIRLIPPGMCTPSKLLYKCVSLHLIKPSNLNHCAHNCCCWCMEPLPMSLLVLPSRQHMLAKSVAIVDK